MPDGMGGAPAANAEEVEAVEVDTVKLVEEDMMVDRGTLDMMAMVRRQRWER